MQLLPQVRSTLTKIHLIFISVKQHHEKLLRQAISTPHGSEGACIQVDAGA